MGMVVVQARVKTVLEEFRTVKIWVEGREEHYLYAVVLVYA